jgi:penicillin-binding protein 1A
VFLLFTLISFGVLGFMPSFEDLENPKSILASQVISSMERFLGTIFTRRTGPWLNSTRYLPI